MSIDPNNLSSTAVITFDDEFNTLSLWNGTSGVWATTTPNVSATGNGSTLANNGEQEWYINSMYAPTASITPWTVNNGVLSLTAAAAPAPVQSYINNYQYTSGEINTYHSFSQTYGYFEMRAELPAGQGFWPAFWLMPESGAWPPEIDVMEVLGNSPTTLYTTVHSGTSSAEVSTGTATTVANTSTGFHTYGVDWEADYITWYFDGQKVFQTPTPSGLNSPMYMIANLAVGGYWPGMANSSTAFPSSMQIDYIRAYEAAPTSAPPTVTPPPNPLFSLPLSGAWTDVITSVRGGKMYGGTAADKLDGHGLAKYMNGEGGNDTFVVYHTTDTVAEPRGAGIATVDSLASSYTLPANIANLTLIGSTPQTANGNSGNNILVSNDYGSTLNGVGGNNILIAGAGPDRLTGGPGDNIFEFNKIPSQAGHVTDFAPSRDILDLRQLFAAAGYHGTNPVADGYLTFVNDGAGDTEVLFDPHAGGVAAASHLITTLDHVTPSQMYMQGDWYFS